MKFFTGKLSFSSSRSSQGTLSLQCSSPSDSPPMSPSSSPKSSNSENSPIQRGRALSHYFSFSPSQEEQRSDLNSDDPNTAISAVISRLESEQSSWFSNFDVNLKERGRIKQKKIDALSKIIAGQDLVASEFNAINGGRTAQILTRLGLLTTFTTQQGTKFEGQAVGGQAKGFGVLRWTTGQYAGLKYEGIWENIKNSSSGTIFLPQIPSMPRTQKSGSIVDTVLKLST